ncbi:Putative pterin-4-alpha-carbinolamine dehydratase [Geodia barretti]|uniref:4a-hydroxytetrahydrobiopterin dehydratase n=1 Tax=Geodia barretti TaxID=519541 RepID=A0AA35R9K4_GEOBA|nr:Putative pterin-4-alpha-carbinolamine dehydratase [Geodia barretti]
MHRLPPRFSPHVRTRNHLECAPSSTIVMIDESGIPKLDRQFKFNNFVNALQFTNALGELAESEGHHPRLTTEWASVRRLVDATQYTHLHRTCKLRMVPRNGQPKPTDTCTVDGLNMRLPF